MNASLRFFTSLFLALASFTAAYAEAPAGYYSTLNGKKGAELKTAAGNIVRSFKLDGSYSTVYNNLKYTFQQTDLYPGSQRWYDMYSDIPLYAPGFSGLNREHSFPKSWWGGLTDINAYVDLNHLYPAEAKANMAKSNYPLGEVDMSTSPYFNNGISKIGYPVSGQGGNAKYVFEPDDEYKGDFARTYFYMATVYQNLTWARQYCYMLVPTGTYPTLNDWAVSLLLRWAKEDPVSQKEILRNEAVYKAQNNRNPFIDLPDLADHIWGDKKNLPYTVGSSHPTGEAVLYAPVSQESLDLGQVAIGSSITGKLLIRGKNLTGNISILVTNRTNPEQAKLFTPAVTSVPAAWANRDNGYYLDITYTPDAIGTHEAQLAVFDGGISGSILVNLKAECLEAPVLTACTATDPSDITSDSYTANWTVPAGETVDYWIVTRTRYFNNASTQTEELLAEDTSLEITDFAASEYETYAVQSVRLGYRSPMSNTVTVRHSGISGVETDEPIVVIGLEGAIRIKCPEPQTGCRIYDVTGRLVRCIDIVEDNTDIDMPLGIYFVTTDRTTAPHKVAVR